jgi:hypothetical protein
MWPTLIVMCRGEGEARGEQAGERGRGEEEGEEREVVVVVLGGWGLKTWRSLLRTRCGVTSLTMSARPADLNSSARVAGHANICNVARRESACASREPSALHARTRGASRSATRSTKRRQVSRRSRRGYTDHTP